MALNIDPAMLSSLMSLDDNTFRAVVSGALLSKGADKATVEKSLADVAKLKKTLANLSEAEIKRAVSVIGSNNTEDLLKMIGEQMGKK